MYTNSSHGNAYAPLSPLPFHKLTIPLGAVLFVCWLLKSTLTSVLLIVVIVAAAAVNLCIWHKFLASEKDHRHELWGTLSCGARNSSSPVDRCTFRCICRSIIIFPLKSPWPGRQSHDAALWAGTAIATQRLMAQSGLRSNPRTYLVPFCLLLIANVNVCGRSIFSISSGSAISFPISRSHHRSAV